MHAEPLRSNLLFGGDAARVETPRAPATSAPTNAHLRLFQPDNPVTALGLAVSHLLNKTPFAQLRFGEWSRILIGQINRKHYQLVLNDANRVVGFLGWALTNEENAETWLRGARGSSADISNGDCIIINAWTADTAAINRFVLHAARAAARHKRLIFTKRYYRDGRVRPIRMDVNEFIGSHVDLRA